MAVTSSSPPRSGGDDLAAALHAQREEVVALWERLGEAGPTFGQEIDVDQAAVRRGYLYPLSRMLECALGGSDVHRASYREARLAYLPKALPGPERAELFAARLADEARELAGRLADGVDPAVTLAALQTLHAPLTRPPAPGDPRVLFVGDCLFSELRCFLSGRFADRHGRMLDSDHVYFSAGIEPLDPAVLMRSIAAAPPALVGLSMFSFSGLPAYAALVGAARGLRGPDLAAVDALIGMLASSIEAIRAVTDTTILVHGSCGLPIGPRVLRHRWIPAQRPGRAKLVAAINDRVAELVAATENTLFVDEDAIVRRNGGLRRVGAPVLGEGFDGAYAHHSRFGDVLARDYQQVLDAHAVLGRAKALLVDLDNTLWDGVMAEGPVRHHVSRQRELKRLREAGVLLVALSKNDPSAIRWAEMELGPDDFVLQQINWRPKPDNVSEAVGMLDLAPEAFVLLDDNPVERALVSENVPGVRALDPADPATDRALAQWLEFPSTRRTDEARRRTEMYRQAAERRRALGGREHDYERMMRSLNLVAEVRPAAPADRERLLELIQRTNQFNTTTRRRSAAEVDQLLADPSISVHVASLKDRFGDLGVVAVVVLRRLAAEIEIDSVIMSCRAMGFGLDQFLLAEVLAGSEGSLITAPFIPTDRNGPAASLYPSCGFAELSPGVWTLGPDDPRPQAPGWLAAGGPHAEAGRPG
ncbi:MAG TPA: HAD-IIIC family phosphatase [Solirubrobacteraceae bacterium]|nr:HAD-IIIC family phosphatase [Solirubrobacteraceae bacterium]